MPDYQTVSVHLTTARLILLPDPSTPSTSSRPPMGLQTRLSHVRQTEFYTGFMRSSPKITLFLGRNPSDDTEEEQESSWTCGVCGFVNSISPPDVGRRCGLCGVSPITPRSAGTSLNGSMAIPDPGAGSRVDPEGRIACPACTFLNHRFLASCELCSTPLPSARRPQTRLPDEEGRVDLVRLSFRKGGEKDAYRKIKSVLGAKAWERQVST